MPSWCKQGQHYLYLFYLNGNLRDNIKNKFGNKNGAALCINRLMPIDDYSGRTAPLTSKRCILYIYSTNTGTEYFKHCLYSPFFPFQNAVCFINLTYLVPVLFTFYIQGVLKLKKNNSGAKRLSRNRFVMLVWKIIGSVLEFVFCLHIFINLIIFSTNIYIIRGIPRGHVARMDEERRVYRFLMGKPEGRKPLGRLKRRWVDNISMDLQDVGCGYMD